MASLFDAFLCRSAAVSLTRNHNRNGSYYYFIPYDIFQRTFGVNCACLMGRILFVEIDRRTIYNVQRQWKLQLYFPHRKHLYLLLEATRP